MPDINISYNILEESGIVLKLSDQVPLSKLLPIILKASGLSPNETLLNQIVVVVARPVEDPGATLYELGVRNGDRIHIVQMQFRLSTVELVLSHLHDKRELFTVRRSPAVLGVVREGAKTANIDVDLGPYLPEIHLISRQQAELIEQDGTWSIKVFPDAKTPMFVDGQPCVGERPIPLAENSVISFGRNSNHPDFQLVVHLRPVKSLGVT